MLLLKMFLALGVFVTCLDKDTHAQQPINTDQTLNNKQRSIITISAFTTKGDLFLLEKSLNEGLNAGLTVNEIKEIIVQLYAYTGFPRSLNALSAFNTVLKERENKGINDPLGKEPSPLPTNKTKLQFGTEMQTNLVGAPVKGEVFEFAPAIDQFLKEHLFADIFGRDNLDWKIRELATISALASLGGAENQLRSHINVGIHNGLTEAELNSVVLVLNAEVGVGESASMKNTLQELNKKNEGTLFPKGDLITNENFTGNAWQHQMIMSDSLNPTQIGNVTFESGARTNWHLHPAGQILLITAGKGYYQEKGSPRKIIRKGETIKCAPNVPHWHGASEDEQLIQIAVTSTHKGATVWLDKVTEQEYKN